MAAAREFEGGRFLPRLAFVGAASVALSNVLGLKQKAEEADGRDSPTELSAPEPQPAPSPGPVPINGVSVVPVDHAPGLIGIAWSIVDRFSRDNATLTAAGIAFYLLLSIFPGLAALVSIYGLVGDPNDVGRQIAPFASLLPPEAMKLLNDGLAGFVKSSANSKMSLALATSLVLALWSARAAMSSIMVGLNIAYEETERRSFLVQTLISIALTLGAVAFTVVALFAVAVIPAILAFVYLDKVVENALIYGRWPLLALLLVLSFAVLYRYAPYRSHPRWRWISWGSAVATVLWLVGSFGFSFYVSHFGSYDATYGSLGAVVVLLLWFWVSALILILGAEIDSELDTRNTNGGSPMAGTKASVGPPVQP